MPRRIAVDARYLQDRYPGIGRALFTFLTALSPDEASQVTVLCDPDRESPRLPLSALEAAGLDLQRAPVRTRSLREQVALPGLVRRRRMELVHSPYPFAALAWPCPWVVTVHDTVPLDDRATLGSPLHRSLLRAWLRLALARARLVLTPSRASAEGIIRRWPWVEARLRVVPLAVQSRFRPATPDTIRRACRRLGLDRPYVLCVAPPRPHKNLSRLVEAWSAVEPGDHRLVLVGRRPSGATGTGDGPGGDAGDRVHRIDEVPEEDLPAVYSGASVLVAPSLHEGFGLTVLEAMACGTPVACSSTSALPEVVGDAALLFDPYRVEEMAAALRRLLADSDLRADLHHGGLLRAARFPPRRLAEQTWAAYELALDGRRRPAEGAPA